MGSISPKATELFHSLVRGTVLAGLSLVTVAIAAGEVRAEAGLGAASGIATIVFHPEPAQPRQGQPQVDRPPIIVVIKPLDLGALPPAAFGDWDTARR